MFSNLISEISCMKDGWLQHKMDDQTHFVLIFDVHHFWSVAFSTEVTWITLWNPLLFCQLKH